MAGATPSFGPPQTSGDVRVRAAVEGKADIKRVLIRAIGVRTPWIGADQAGTPLSLKRPTAALKLRDKSAAWVSKSTSMSSHPRRAAWFETLAIPRSVRARTFSGVRGGTDALVAHFPDGFCPKMFDDDSEHHDLRPRRDSAQSREVVI